MQLFSGLPAIYVLEFQCICTTLNFNVKFKKYTPMFLFHFLFCHNPLISNDRRKKNRVKSTSPSAAHCIEIVVKRQDSLLISWPMP